MLSAPLAQVQTRSPDPKKHEAPRSSRGFAGSPHRCGFISLRHRSVCRHVVTGFEAVL